ncbi:xylose repressor [Sphaerisporangium melleum]|uniref:Xylose repressor n=1 Tax=Sphaerisporangium melleum TaxID=321316 RepID=A0A917R1Z3_9ACTN|nr:ROK family transcriptional regulator [Sphaerisporangium melleum]GGK85425.1 xylose repressor [Sphaerisporangium melleum]GII70535.1 xylose repressor [Sphaerisporangium melleum]
MEVGEVGRARAIQVQGMLAVLRHVHAHPATTRARLARDLGLSRGSAAEIIARLHALRLVAESGAEPTGARGRPTRVVHRHDRGPVVAVAELSHESWGVAIAHLGGELCPVRRERHDRPGAPEDVLARMGAALREVQAAYGTRLRAVGIALPGTVSDGRLVAAATLGWRDVDIARGLGIPFSMPVITGNDATMAGVAEARRGSAADAGVALFLTVEVGIGGVLLERGRAATGATGAGGEFGHMPFGDPALPCPCGAHGCWDLEVDGRALARYLEEPPPAAPRTAAGAVLHRARTGDAAARAALDRVAGNLGRGVAGLVNALDPQVVTLSGLAVVIADLAGPAVRAAYLAGLMGFRRRTPPPLVPARFPDDGSMRGAAELAFDAVLSEAGLDEWRRDARDAAG